MTIQLTQAEVLDNLGLKGTSVAAALNAYKKMDNGVPQHRNLYLTFAGANAPEVEDRFIETVVHYLIAQAVQGKPLDVDACIDQTLTLAAKMPGSYSVSAAAERKMERDKARAERTAAYDSLVAAGADKPAEPVDPNAPPVFKRGRKPAGVKSVFEQVADLWRDAADRSKEGFIAYLIATLSLKPGTAQTYYYKALKEIKLETVDA